VPKGILDYTFVSLLKRERERFRLVIRCLNVKEFVNYLA